MSKNILHRWFVKFINLVVNSNKML